MSASKDIRAAISRAKAIVAAKADKPTPQDVAAGLYETMRQMVQRGFSVNVDQPKEQLSRLIIGVNKVSNSGGYLYYSDKSECTIVLTDLLFQVNPADYADYDEISDPAWKLLDDVKAALGTRLESPEFLVNGFWNDDGPGENTTMINLGVAVGGNNYSLPLSGETPEEVASSVIKGLDSLEQKLTAIGEKHGFPFVSFSKRGGKAIRSMKAEDQKALNKAQEEATRELARQQGFAISINDRYPDFQVEIGKDALSTTMYIRSYDGVPFMTFVPKFEAPRGAAANTKKIARSMMKEASSYFGVEFLNDEYAKSRSGNTVLMFASHPDSQQGIRLDKQEEPEVFAEETVDYLIDAETFFERLASKHGVKYLPPK